METTVRIKNRDLNIKVEITEVAVYVTTLFDGRKRTTSFSSVNNALQNSTFVPVKNYLKSLI